MNLSNVMHCIGTSMWFAREANVAVAVLVRTMRVREQLASKIARAIVRAPGGMVGSAFPPEIAHESFAFVRCEVRDSWKTHPPVIVCALNGQSYTHHSAQFYAACGPSSPMPVPE